MPAKRLGDAADSLPKLHAAAVSRRQRQRAMMIRPRALHAALLTLVLPLATTVGCDAQEPDDDADGTAGESSTGGDPGVGGTTSTGGAPQNLGGEGSLGGQPTTTGGGPSTGGAEQGSGGSSGGSASGGSASGGSASGGATSTGGTGGGHASGGHSSGSGGTGSGGDGSGGGPIVQNCTSFTDRTGELDDRGILWTQDVASDPERCMGILVGQSVTWTANFGSHPLLPSGGDSPSPITTDYPASGDHTILFTAAGTFGFICENHGEMRGAVRVLEP